MLRKAHKPNKPRAAVKTVGGAAGIGNLDRTDIGEQRFDLASTHPAFSSEYEEGVHALTGWRLQPSKSKRVIG